MTKTQCIDQLAHRCGGIWYNNTGIGVWYTKLAVVVGGRAECEFGFGVWRQDVLFCLPTMMGCHIRYQFVA